MSEAPVYTECFPLGQCAGDWRVLAQLESCRDMMSFSCGVPPRNQQSHPDECL